MENYRFGVFSRTTPRATGMYFRPVVIDLSLELVVVRIKGLGQFEIFEKIDFFFCFVLKSSAKSWKYDRKGPSL